MSALKRHQVEFADQRYTIVEQLIAESVRLSAFQHALQRAETPTMLPDSRVPGTPAAYGDPRMEDLLNTLKSPIEQITGLSLFPTYSYFRVYKAGDVLVKHKDRPSCEVSVSANLGYVAAEPWPLWIEGSHGPRCADLRPGDAVIYRGTECPHWREPFLGELAAQVFLHYVDKSGPRSEWKFDKRKRLGTVPQCAVRISEQVRLPVGSDGVLQLGAGRTMNLATFEAFVWRDLERHVSVQSIVRHAIEQLHIGEVEAMVKVMDFVSRCENKDLLFVDDAS